MKYFCPTMMDGLPEETDKDTFLALMLKKRPEYAIVWDVHGRDVIDFTKRVWIVSYVVISGQNVYFSGSRHYARRARKLFRLKEIIEVESEEEWIKLLPEKEDFKKIRYYAPKLTEDINEIELEDLVVKMLTYRPPFAVLWNVSLEDIEYIASRAYCTSYMPVIENTVHYSYAKYFAVQAQKRFQIPNRKKIYLQVPKLL